MNHTKKEMLNILEIQEQGKTAEKSESARTVGYKPNDGEIENLIGVIEQVINNSHPCPYKGILIKSSSAWQVLLNAYDFYKAKGL